MTMAPFPIGANAAHEPSPAAGGSFIPSTVTVTSVRGQPIFTTPSGVAAAVAPLASLIAFTSSAGGPAILVDSSSVRAATGAATRIIALSTDAQRTFRLFMIDLQ